MMWFLPKAGAGTTGFSGSDFKTGFNCSVLFFSGPRIVVDATITAASSLDDPPLDGFCTGAVIFDILLRCCPADFFRHLARLGLRKNLCHREQTQLKF